MWPGKVTLKSYNSWKKAREHEGAGYMSLYRRSLQGSDMSNSLTLCWLYPARLLNLWDFPLGWMAILSSRKSFWPRDRPASSTFPALAGGLFTTESPGISKTEGTAIEKAVWKKQACLVGSRNSKCSWNAAGTVGSNCVCVCACAHVGMTS